MTTAKDPYKILGIAKGSTEDEVRSAFLSKVKEYYSRTNNGEGDSVDYAEAHKAMRNILQELKVLPASVLPVCTHCGGTKFCDCFGCQDIKVRRSVYPTDTCAFCPK